MESRKMVLKTFLTGQQWRNRHRELTCRHGERGGEGEMYGLGREIGRGSRKGGDTCIPLADSCWGMTENNKIL